MLRQWRRRRRLIYAPPLRTGELLLRLEPTSLPCRARVLLYVADACPLLSIELARTCRPELSRAITVDCLSRARVRACALLSFYKRIVLKTLKQTCVAQVLSIRIAIDAHAH